MTYAIEEVRKQDDEGIFAFPRGTLRSSPMPHKRGECHVVTNEGDLPRSKGLLVGRSFRLL